MLILSLKGAVAFVSGRGEVGFFIGGGGYFCHQQGRLLSLSVGEAAFVIDKAATDREDEKTIIVVVIVIMSLPPKKTRNHHLSPHHSIACPQCPFQNVNKEEGDNNGQECNVRDESDNNEEKMEEGNVREEGDDDGE